MIKQRILQIIDYKQIKSKDFFKKIGVSHANFSGKGLYNNLGSDKIVDKLGEKKVAL